MHMAECQPTALSLKIFFRIIGILNSPLKKHFIMDPNEIFHFIYIYRWRCGSGSWVIKTLKSFKIKTNSTNHYFCLSETKMY